MNKLTFSGGNMTEEQKRMIPRIVFWKREIEDIESFIDYFGKSTSKTKPFFETRIMFCFINAFHKTSDFQCSDVIATGFLDYMRHYKEHLEKLVSECDKELVEIADMYLKDEMELN